MQPASLPALPSGKPTAWEEAIYAFLVEKRSRSGSTRTVESYARMLWPFFRVTTPDQVRSADVLAYAHGIGASGRVPSSTTVGARIACLSSFYRFMIRMGLLAANPCDALERPRTVPSVARGYSAAEVRRLLAAHRIADAVECSTIHRFQGRECDVVIIDLVDAAPMRQSALLADAPNLLNVSISRARGKLVIVADVAYFETSAPEGIVAALLRAASSLGLGS